MYSIIIPTYNEKENIAILLWMINETFKSTPYSYEAIIVDDNSPDGTSEVVKRLQKVLGAEKVVLLSRPGKLGLGTAYKFGLNHAKGEFVILMDADLSHDPKFLLSFIKRQEQTKCDVVTGTRYSRGGGVAGWTLWRKITSRGANLLASTLLGAKASDLTGSFRLYRKAVLIDVLSQVSSKGYAFQMEVMVSAQYKNYKIEEVPIVFVDRVYGKSKLDASEYVMFLKGLIKLFFIL